MLDQNAVLDANDVRRNPVHREAEVRKSSVHDDEIPFSQNRSVLIFEVRGICDARRLAGREKHDGLRDPFGSPYSLSGTVAARTRLVRANKHQSAAALVVTVAILSLSSRNRFVSKTKSS